jgi:hypothetical protein
MIGSVVRTASESGGEKQLATVREKVECNEHEIVRDAIGSEVMKAGFPRADGREGSAALHLKVVDFGVREVQRGFVVPYATVSAKLISAAGKRLWSATAQSSGVERRAAENYGAKSYCDDFKLVAEDLASQMIRGPIRPLETR